MHKTDSETSEQLKVSLELHTMIIMTFCGKRNVKMFMSQLDGRLLKYPIFQDFWETKPVHTTVCIRHAIQHSSLNTWEWGYTWHMLFLLTHFFLDSHDLLFCETSFWYFSKFTDLFLVVHVQLFTQLGLV